jgi:1,4-alpha-glucan branching enzyme
MPGYLSLVLHAHLPFVRHPEHEKFLEENWLFEAITETYVPLLRIMNGWQRDDLDARLTLTLTPTLCAMLLDPLLQERYTRHLNGLIELAEKEIQRTHFDKALSPLAQLYHQRFIETRDFYFANERNLVATFKRFQDLGKLEIMTSAATHALLPLLADHPPSLRAQILTARDHYRGCFDRDPRGIWLPECAYVEAIEPVLQEANIRWFILDAHGLMHAQPSPRYGVFAPVFTPNGIAAFARDLESSKQVWSRTEGYPGDPRYREFYRDIGFDLEVDYVNDYLPAPGIRGFTGIKYFRITGSEEKQIYDPRAALEAAESHAQHFLDSRVSQIQALEKIMDRPPLVLAPYDAELFGHWWHEGPEFLDLFLRKVAAQKTFSLITPTEYLLRNPTNQIAKPAASSWGEHGYWGVWLNETNQWIVPHLNVAQERMTELAKRFASPTPLEHRALNQAARELLLAQASDWPFILRTGTSPGYATKRVKEHLLRFTKFYEQLTSGAVDEQWLKEIESRNNLFPAIDFSYWRPPH